MPAISSSPSYLLSKNHGLFFRIRVPLDLRNTLGRREYKYRLDSSSLAESRLVAFSGAITAKRLFNNVRTGKMTALTNDQIRELGEKWIRQALQDAYDEHVDRNRLMSYEELDRTELGIDEGISQYTEALIVKDYGKVKEPVKELLSDAGYHLDDGSTEYNKLCHELLIRYCEFLEIERDRLYGDYSDKYFAQPPVAALPVEHSVVQPTPLLSEAVEKYVDVKVRMANWLASTVKDNKPMLLLFIEVVGDRPCDTLTGELVEHYSEHLSALPSNRTKKVRYRDKSLDDLWELYKDGEIPSDDLIGPTTISNHFNKVSSFLDWAKRKTYSVEPGLSDLLDARVAKQSSAGRKVGLKPFSSDDLSKLFRSTEYLQDTFNKSWKFWLPILALYTGARLEELCQLSVDDIRQDHDIWVINISDDGDKKTKREASNRLVPIHPFVGIHLGFIEYVGNLKSQRYDRIFNELKRDSKGKYGGSVSKFFTRYRRKCGVEDGKAFHSFRHTVINELKQQGVDDVKRMEMVGHDVDSVHERYAQKYNPKTILEDVITELKWHNMIEIDHLAKSKWAYHQND